MKCEVQCNSAQREKYYNYLLLSVVTCEEYVCMILLPESNLYNIAKLHNLKIVYWTKMNETKDYKLASSYLNGQYCICTSLGALKAISISKRSITITLLRI